MTEYARQFTASAAALILPVRDSSFKAAIARQFLPYCITPVGDHFMLLSREYKPLGWPTRRRGFIDYTDAQYASMLLWVDHAFVSRLPRRTTEHGTFFYLYGPDGIPPPWESDEAAAHYIAGLRQLLDTTSISREGAV